MASATRPSPDGRADSGLDPRPEDDRRRRPSRAAAGKRRSSSQPYSGCSNIVPDVVQVMRDGPDRHERRKDWPG